jgi:hypothetical protein
MSENEAVRLHARDVAGAAVVYGPIDVVFDSPDITTTGYRTGVYVNPGQILWNAALRVIELWDNGVGMLFYPHDSGAGALFAGVNVNTDPITDVPPYTSDVSTISANAVLALERFEIVAFDDTGGAATGHGQLFFTIQSPTRI